MAHCSRDVAAPTFPAGRISRENTSIALTSLQHAFDQARVGLAIIALDGRVELANREMTRIVGAPVTNWSDFPAAVYQQAVGQIDGRQETLLATGVWARWQTDMTNDQWIVQAEDLTTQRGLEGTIAVDAERLKTIAALHRDVEQAEFDLDGVVGWIIERTRTLLGAGAVSVGIVEGDEIVYHVTTHRRTDDGGVRAVNRSRIGASLAGICIRTGEAVLCDDSELDPRVDIAACRAAGLRSMIISPLRHRGEIAGVLNLWSRQPLAFSPSDVHTAELIAGTVSAAYSHAADLAAKRGLLNELRTTVAALKESEAQYRRLFEDAVIGIYRVTPSGELLVANPALVRMLGYTSLPELEPALDDLRRIFHAADASGDFHDQLEREGAAKGMEAAWRRRDGSVVSLRVSAHVVRSAGGDVLCVEGTVEDVTEQRQLEAQLRQTERLAAVGELAAGVAHEVNNPLAAILMRAELNLQESLPAELHEDLTVIYQEARRAGDIVRSLLRFARQREPSLAPVQLAEVIGEALRLQADRFTRHRITVLPEVQPAPEVQADRDQLLQVLVNLTGNAIDAMRPQGGGQLTVQLAAVREVVELTIQDTGPGISPEFMDRIFDPFFTTKPVGQGTGLGLSVSHRVITDHGGTITAANPPEGGARFQIRLPQRPLPADTADQPTRGAVLMLLPEGMAADFLAEVVQLLGYRVERCHEPSRVQADGAAYVAVLASLAQPSAPIEGLRAHWPAARLVAISESGAAAPGWDAVLRPSYTLDDVERALAAEPVAAE